MIRNITKLITFLFITLGVSQVSLEIKNVLLDAETVDIYMSNYPACSYCADSIYNYNSQNWWDKKTDCEEYGDTTWVAYEQMTEEECAAIPSIDGNGGWWFNGEVSGFQFQLTNIDITGASGGSANNAGFEVITYATDVPSGISKVIGFSLTASTIPIGSDVLLTQVTFTDFEGVGICFGEDTGSAGMNVISGLQEVNGYFQSLYVAADWGDCFIFEEECGAALGDVTGDGQINILDLVQIANLILEISTPAYECAADYTGDGQVNILDLVQIANYIISTS